MSQLFNLEQYGVKELSKQKVREVVGGYAPDDGGCIHNPLRDLFDKIFKRKK